MDFVDPKSKRGQEMIAETAAEHPTTQGDPPPPSLIVRLRAPSHKAGGFRDGGALLAEAADALDHAEGELQIRDVEIDRELSSEDAARKRLGFTFDFNRERLIRSLATMPGFGYYVLACVQGAMTHGALTQIWPDGIGGFTQASRDAITETRAAADAYLEALRNPKGDSV